MFNAFADLGDSGVAIMKNVGGNVVCNTAIGHCQVLRLPAKSVYSRVGHGCQQQQAHGPSYPER